MKIFKKFLAALVAAVMVFAMVAFTACDTGSDNNSNNENNNPNSPSNPNNPANPGNPSNPTEQPSAEKLLAAVADTGSSLTASLFYENSTSEDMYYVDELDGAKPAEGVNTVNSKITQNVSINADIEKGNADIVTNSVGEADDEENDFYVTDNTYIEYSFLRDWNMFTYLSAIDKQGKVEEVSDFTGKTLFYSGNANDMLMELIGGMTGGAGQAPGIGVASAALSAEEQTPAFSLSMVSGMAMPQFNTFLAKLAVATDTLQMEGNTYTVDVVKALNKIKADLVKVAIGCQSSTTVEAVLTNPTVKNYITLFTDYIPAETLYGAICGLVLSYASDTDFGPMIAMLGIDQNFLIDIAPEEGATSYEYLLALLANESVKDVANKAMALLESMGNKGEDSTSTAALAEDEEEIVEVFTQTLEKTTLGTILQLANIQSFDFKTISEMVDALPFKISADGITVKSSRSLRVNFGDGNGEDSSAISVKNDEETKYTKIEFAITVESGKVTAQSVNFESQLTEKESYLQSITSGIYTVYETSNTVAYSIDIAYGAVEALTDINSCTVVKSEEFGGFKDDENGCDLVFIPYNFDNDDYLFYGTIQVSVTPKVDAQGNVVGLYVNGDKENPVYDGGSCRIIANVEVCEIETGDSQMQDVEFTVVFALNQNSYYVEIVLRTEQGAFLDNSFIYESYYEIYYTSSVSAILAGTPNWTLAQD